MLKVKTNELLNVLNKMNKCDGATIDVYKTFKFKVDHENDVVHVSSFDGLHVRLSAVVKCYENTKELSEFVVDKKNLLKALKLYGEYVTIKYDENQNVLFADEKKKLSLNCFDDYHDMDNKIYTKKLEVESDFTKELFKHIKYPSKSEVRPILTGICLKDNTIVSTDSYRLCKTIFDKYNIENELNVPCYIVKAIKDMKEEIKTIKYNRFNDGLGNKGINHMEMSFVLNDIVIELRTIDGSYPNTERLIPTDYLFQAKFDRDELTKNIKLLKGMSAKDDGKVNMDFNTNELSINLNKNGDMFSVSFKNEDKKEFVICYSLQFMLEALEHMGDKNVLINFIGEMKPFIVKDNSPTLSLVLPCRRF